MSKVNFIRNYAKKNLLKTTDEGIMIIPNTQKVDFQEGILRQLLIENGINPDAIKSDGAMNEAMAFINQSSAAKTKTIAKDNVIDITDQMPSPFKNIKEATKKGDFTGIKNQLLRDPDIAREFAMMKKFPTRTAEGEEAIPLAMRAKFDEEMGIKSISDRDYSVEKLVSDFKKFGNATDKDIQMILKSGKSGQIPYVMDNYGMSYTEVLDTLKKGKPLIEGLAKGGRAGFANGSEGLSELLNMTPRERNRLKMKKLADKIKKFVNIEAEGSKSGKQQIIGAPEGITMDNETYKILLNSKFPITDRINFLTTYGRDKGRTRVEKDDQELILGEGGSRKRAIGLDINPGGEGISGQLMYDVDKGEPEFKIQLLKRFAEGGRIGFSQGLGPRFIKFLSENSPVQAFKKYNKSVKDRMKEGKELEVASEVIPIAASGALVTNQLKKMLKNMNEEQKKERQDKMFEEFSQEYKEKYKDSPELLEKMLLDLHKNIYMEEKADGGRIGYAEGNGVADEDAQTAKFAKRVRELMDDGFDMGEAVRQAMKEGYKDGGRIGLKEGMDRRTFMKIMGGLATIPILGKFFKTGKTAKVAKDVTKVVPNTQPPDYFFSLAEKIKLLGKESKVKPQERVNEYYYTGKNGDEYTLTEDISTGDMQIVKDKTGVGVYNDKSFDTINDRTVMDYKKGRGDETTKGTPPDEYDEYKVEFDQDGTMAGADDISEIVKKEIVDEVSDNIPSIKKASGGIARMLGE